MVHIETQEVKVLRSNQKNAKMGPGCRHSFRVVRGCGWRVWGLQPFTTYSRPSFGAEGTMPGDTSVSVSIFVLWVLFCCVCAAQFVFAGGARRVFFAAGVFCCGCSGRRAASKTPKNPEP